MLGWLEDIALWLLGALVAAGAWAVRCIFTNQKEIALVKQSLESLKHEIGEMRKSNTELIDLIKELVKK